MRKGRPAATALALHHYSEGFGRAKGAPTRRLVGAVVSARGHVRACVCAPLTKPLSDDKRRPKGALCSAVKGAVAAAPNLRG